MLDSFSDRECRKVLSTRHIEVQVKWGGKEGKKRREESWQERRR